MAAARSDLAEKETLEAGILSTLVPPMLPETDVDKILKTSIEELHFGDQPKKALGTLMKAFYSKVDKSLVDAELVKQRADLLLSNPDGLR